MQEHHIGNDRGLQCLDRSLAYEKKAITTIDIPPQVQHLDR
jgi:hypothetical protein